MMSFSSFQFNYQPWKTNLNLFSIYIFFSFRFYKFSSHHSYCILFKCFSSFRLLLLLTVNKDSLSNFSFFAIAFFVVVVDDYSLFDWKKIIVCKLHNEWMNITWRKKLIDYSLVEWIFIFLIFLFFDFFSSPSGDKRWW